MHKKIDIHREILSNNQINTLPLIASFKNNFILVGGTAIALQVGHRRSIDFDLFSSLSVDNRAIITELQSQKTLDKIMINSKDELTVLVNGVKITWYKFPHSLTNGVNADFCRMPDLETLGAMKLLALGGRAKWKDYVDIYTLIRHRQFKLSDLTSRARLLFGTAFNEKLIRVQLSYYKDVSFEEKVIWMPGWKVEQEEIKQFLTELSLGD